MKAPKKMAMTLEIENRSSEKNINYYNINITTSEKMAKTREIKK